MTETSGASVSDKVSMSSRLAFGVGDFGFVMVWQGTTLFLMYFYTDVAGISPFVAGSIYLAAMVWDAVTDPMFATLAERTRTRWGRYRPWIVCGAIPFGVAYPLAFSTTPTSAIAPWVWALATHIFLRTMYTVVSMPFNSMQARLTHDADERTVLAGFRMVGAASGGMAIAFVTPFVVGIYAASNEATGYLVAAAISGSMAALGLIYCGTAMREPERDDVAASKTGFFEDLAKMFRLFVVNPPLIRVFGIIVVGSICLGMFGKNVLYYFKYDIEQPELALPALLLPAALLIVVTPFWVWLSKRTSKRVALERGLWIAILGYLLFFLNFEGNIMIAFLAIGLIGIGGGAVPVMFWAMLPDTIEFGEAATGVRAEARTFGFATFAQKAAVGINALLLGGLLGWIGFEANTVQSDQTLTALRGVMALVPAAGAIAMLAILRGYKLDQQMHRNLRLSA
ncbi:MFS transporter [Altererythrobacter lutimaris]|uniref:MFS transporter n=1 Tax=Altererythrobacter lutimaris TaxID=2743979 RepID=A0A850HBH9_9SPHN|nr:glycoside-pentoside-hexuronide (GPH):cation symporter [Altererythrobacter lutimaris]NVE94361.1 MFS transporter [Altererythrobacter lutimaris]